MEGANGSYRAHALILPFPSQGHINPMLQFAKRLVSKGVKATLVNTIFISNSMHAFPSSFINVETISDGFDDRGFSQAKNCEDYLTTFQAVGSQTLSHLIKKLKDSGNSISTLIYDSLMPWALDVAKQFGVLGVVFFTQSCAVNNIYYHLHKGLLRLPLLGPSVSIPGLPLLQVMETPTFVYDSEFFSDFYHASINQFSNIDDVDWVLCVIFYEMEKEVVDRMGKLWKMGTIGPTLPSVYLDKRLEDDKDYGINLFKPNTSACMSWLKDKPRGSVVYVSFGSLAEIKVEQMEEVAWSLKGSNCHFLWVVRAKEEAKLPIMFKEDVSEKGLVVTWCNQLEVLSHESIGCFVTHCGFNSLIEALSLGVPMVAIPHWSDQTTNAKFVEDIWRMGIRPKPDEKGIVRREEIELCIKEVMEGEKGKEIKKNSDKWKKLAREAIDEGGSSDKNIDEFVTKLVSTQSV
ncbi:UDPGT domain-containing protein [Cephalotus follicularis]|uniref:Glycosyltransferase n=1 Tax=Cephalotus follicularis TaxID=3775 RepID=A0A1Q3BKE5_CEPFO|nr:UDPGT domain-containing protein [Cephalotus follicularis]